MFGGTWGGFSIQEDCGTGGIAQDRKRGDFVNWSEAQTDFRARSFLNLNVLPQRFKVLQSGGNLVRAERNVSERVWGHLGRLSIQEDCGTGGIAQDRKRGDFVNWSEAQTDFRARSFLNLNVLPQRFKVLQSGGNLMRAERNVSERVWWHLRRLSVQEDCGTAGIALGPKARRFPELV